MVSFWERFDESTRDRGRPLRLSVLRSLTGGSIRFAACLTVCSSLFNCLALFPMSYLVDSVVLDFSAILGFFQLRLTMEEKLPLFI